MSAVIPAIGSAVEALTRMPSKCHEEQRGHVTDLTTLVP